MKGDENDERGWKVKSGTDLKIVGKFKLDICG